MKQPRERIASIYRKVISQNPEIVYNSVKKRRKRIISNCVKSLVILVACVAVLFLFQETAIPVIENGNGITADDLIKKYGEINLYAVYSASDDWSKDTAEYIARKLDGIDHLTVSVIPDDEYVSAGRPLLPGEQAPGYSSSTDKNTENGNCITVSIGHTLLEEESYIDAYLRLGDGGYEISHSDAVPGEHERISLIAFDAASAASAATKFTSYFTSASHFTRLFGKLYVSKTGDRIASPIILEAPGEEAPDMLVISRPGADDTSLAALEKMLSTSGASLVIFNGGLSCSTSGRQELEAAWEMISAVLEKHSVKWFCVFSQADKGSAISASAVKEVIHTYGGSVFTDGTNGWILYTDKDGKPLSAVAVSGLNGAPDPDLDFLKVIYRAAGKEIPSAAVIPGAPEGILSAPVEDTKDPSYKFGFYETPDEYLGEKYALFAGNALSLGMPCVFYAGNNNAGVFASAYAGANGYTGFCGSLDYLSYGLGGRYSLNHSLRGGIVIGFSGENAVLSYLRAADCN